MISKMILLGKQNFSKITFRAYLVAGLIGTLSSCNVHQYVVLKSPAPVQDELNSNAVADENLKLNLKINPDDFGIVMEIENIGSTVQHIALHKFQFLENKLIVYSGPPNKVASFNGIQHVQSRDKSLWNPVNNQKFSESRIDRTDKKSEEPDIQNEIQILPNEKLRFYYTPFEKEDWRIKDQIPTNESLPRPWMDRQSVAYFKDTHKTYTIRIFYRGNLNEPDYRTLETCYTANYAFKSNLNEVGTNLVDPYYVVKSDKGTGLLFLFLYAGIFVGTAAVGSAIY